MMSNHSNPKRVLVTGANGHTGSHLVSALLCEGVQVRGLVRRPETLAPEVRSLIEVAVGDIRDRRAVEQAVEGCDTVYHVAALYRDASARRQDYWDINVGGTDHILVACATHGVKRLVHCSTVGVHGDVTTIPTDETAPFKPGDAYQRSKLAAEERVWAWYRKTQIPTVVIRPAGIYGPGDMRFLKLFRAIRNGRFVMLGSGTTLFHAVYIQDLIHGYLLCGTRPEAVGEAFVISGDRYVTLNDLVASIASTLGVARPRWHAPVWPFYVAGAVCETLCVPLNIQPPIYRRRVGFFTHNRAFTSAKAQRVLGYVPQVTLEEGLRATARWYMTRGYLRTTNGWQGRVHA